MSRCSTSSGRSRRSTVSPAIATAGTWPRGCPVEQTVEIGGAAIALVHDSGPDRDRRARLRARFPGARVVCFGHTPPAGLRGPRRPPAAQPGLADRAPARPLALLCRADDRAGRGGRGAHRPALKRGLSEPLGHQPGSLSIECWISASSGSGGGGGAWDAAIQRRDQTFQMRVMTSSPTDSSERQRSSQEHGRELLRDDHECIARRRVRLGAAQAREPVGHVIRQPITSSVSSQPETSSSKGAEPPSTQSTKRRPTAMAARPISQQPTRQSGLLVAGPRPMCQASSAAGELERRVRTDSPRGSGGRVT